MERTAVRSSEIALVGYDEQAMILEITFRRGGVYHYFKVPAEVYQSFLNSESLGTYFSNEIKDRFTYEKVC